MEEVATPEPKSGEVRIAVEVCGICGSDIHAYYGKHPFIRCPIVPRHEFSGRIDVLGDDVEGLRIGQKVTADPSLVCGKCEHCRTGRYNICNFLKVIGCQSDGAQAEYVVVPANKVVPLPDEMSFIEGVLVEPTAVAVHALRRVELKPEHRMLVVGAGAIGL